MINPKKTGVFCISIFSMILLSLSFHALAVDQCNTTQECKNKFGSTATDCLNSKKNNSVCMCGSVACDTGTPSSKAASSAAPIVSSAARSSTPSGGGMIGQFDTSNDLFLAFHDNKPDKDDIHAQAAVGTMLRDPRFSNVKHHAVQGTIGTQSGNQLNSSSLFNLIYGSTNWSNAIGNGRAGALSTVTTKAIAALDAGGDIWIMEAGQSDFSADLVRNIKSQRSSVNTKTRVHIAQHSQWNENNTTAADLAYVKSNTDYNVIRDGSCCEFNLPDLNSNTNNAAHWDKALSMPDPVDDYWREARRLAKTLNSTHNNATIEGGGMDFSETVQALWIFGLNDEVRAASDDIMGFFNEFD